METDFVCCDCKVRFKVSETELAEMKAAGYPDEYPDSYKPCPECGAVDTTKEEYYKANATIFFDRWVFEAGRVYSTAEMEGRIMRACVLKEAYVGIVGKVKAPPWSAE